MRVIFLSVAPPAQYADIDEGTIRWSGIVPGLYEIQNMRFRDSNGIEYSQDPAVWPTMYSEIENTVYVKAI